MCIKYRQYHPLKMLHYQKQIDDVVEKYAELGTSYLFNSAGGANQIINKHLRNASKQRIYILIKQRKCIPYNTEFSKYENQIIYNLVTKTLLHLSQFS